MGVCLSVFLAKQQPRLNGVQGTVGEGEDGVHQR